MNRLTLGLMGFGTILLVTGCATERVYYTPSTTAYTTTYAAVPAVTKTYYHTPAYNSPDYVYTASYHTSPYWDIDYYNDSDAYYYGYNDLGDVGYWGMYNTYQVY